MVLPEFEALDSWFFIIDLFLEHSIFDANDPSFIFEIRLIELFQLLMLVGFVVWAP
jgi:hypothetical protein